MPKPQEKLSNLPKNSPNIAQIGHVLDLEKKYFDLLWKLFTAENFINDLKSIEKDIQNQYNHFQNNYKIKNKLKIAAERVTAQYIYFANFLDNREGDNMK